MTSAARLLAWISQLPPSVRALGWALLALGANGYVLGTTDQSIHLTFLRKLMDPSLFAGDLVADAAAARPSLFWQIQAPLFARLGFGAMPAVYATVWFASLIATFWMYDRLALSLGSKWWAPALLVVFHCVPGHARTFEPELINRTVAQPLVLGALWCALAGELELGAMVAGFAFLLHATTATHVFGILCVMALVRPRAFPAILAGFGLFAAPLLLGRPHGELWVDDAWMHVLAWRMPHHLFPWTWPAGVWVVAAVYFALCVAGRQRAVVTGVMIWSTIATLGWRVAPILALHAWESWILLAIVGLLCVPKWLPSRWLPLAILLALPWEEHLMGRPIERAFTFTPAIDQALLDDVRAAPDGPVSVSPFAPAWLRPWSGRALYVTTKDGGEAVFSREFAMAWRTRLAVACGEDVLAGQPTDWLGYRGVREACAAALDRKGN